MKSFTTILALAAAAGHANAHATVMLLHINGVSQGLGNSADGYIRSPPNNNPITDVTSSSMTCNVNNAATAKTLQVKAGDEVTFEWHHNNADASDDIIADSHKGPILTYIAPTESNGEGDVWVKLAEEGFDGSKWAVDKLIANKGKYSVKIPDVAAGEYLLRSEIIALHEGSRESGAQFYMECAQIEVTSSGSTSLPAGVAIPGTYTATDKGILFDIYNMNTAATYPIPGPVVWKASDSGAKPSEVAPSSATEAPTTSVIQSATSVVVPTPTSVVPPPVTSSAVPAPTTLATSIVSKLSSSSVGSTPTSIPEPEVSVAKYARCGGIGHSGSTTCASGSICKEWNPWYFQCIEA